MDEEAEVENKPKRKHKHSLRFRVIRAIIIIVVVIVVILCAVLIGGKMFTAAEHNVRSDWSVETGDLIVSQEDLDVNVYEAAAQTDGLTVVQLSPAEVGQEDFSYYDEGVQNRLAEAVGQLKEEADSEWTPDDPLAVLNPFGSASNELYLYFETDSKTQVSYTIHVDEDDIPDYTQTAANTWLDGDGEDGAYTNKHEFQIIGLVPGKTNEVTLEVKGSWGNVRQTDTFTIDMPETQSGYSTKLDSTEGTSDAELTDGLFTLMRVNGLLGYAFFYDNDGIMRYEMILEGYGLDRMLDYEDDMVTTVSSKKIVRMDGLGRSKRVYNTGEYDMHHDINYTNDENKVVTLAENLETESTEDLVLEVDLESGEVTELIDFTSLMDDYVSEYTRVIAPTDAFFWQAGERDWIHINSVQWLPGEDSLLVSSRETSSIIKMKNVHDNPEIDYMIGDESFWEGTPYEGLNLEPASDFKLQYGQHAVEYDGAYGEEGADVEPGSSEEAAEEGNSKRYYLLMFDNNYSAINTRSDGYSPDLDDRVNTDLYGLGGAVSYMYRYLVDEEARTFDLVDSFEVPYSSIVSNVSHIADSTNYVINSGMSKVYGEYDENGEMIKEFAYECELQNYRTVKNDFVGFWFAEGDDE